MKTRTTSPSSPGAGRVARRRGPLAILAIAGLLVLFSGAPAGPAPVRAAGLSVDLDQWANLADAWQNGNLNGNNARYPEGGVIPFRLAVEGLTAGKHTITISYDFTASGHKAYDFLATWNATNHPGLCRPSGGAISTMCPGLPAPASFAFPSDPFVANGLTVRGAQAWSGASRRLTIYGGTIDAITGPTHAGSVNGNSTAELSVRFRSTGSAVLMAWGGHLAQSAYWDTVAGGARDGAVMVSGAPWHMRTLNLDGGGARNQDRSIQPSAVVGEMPPFALNPTPAPAPTPPPGSSVGGPGSPGSSKPTVPPTATGAPDPAGPRPGSPGLAAWAAALAAASVAVALLGARRSGRRIRRD
jgi:hypothetical protein